jgi:DNA-binding response OmpR family regulator
MTALLLIEDDRRVAAFLERGLAAEGYAVELAIDGRTGLALARTEPFDLIVLDGMLPGLSGRDVLAQLRAGGVRTPVLMLTAMDATQDKIEGLRAGADDYLTKPFDFDELLARLEALLRRANPAAAAPSTLLRAGAITLDRSTMAVTVNSAPVDLTATEFQLLDLLMSAQGKVLSRARILNKIWGMGADPLTNIVDVYIRRLRAKLAMEAETGAIRTVRGFGYRFQTDTPNEA